MNIFIIVLIVFILFGSATGVAFLVGGTVGHAFACKLVRYGKYVLRRLTGRRGENDVLFPILTVSQSARLSRAIKLTYFGDLILLREAVQRALCNDGTYDFIPMFKHVQGYFKTSDCTLGVFEGPCAGTGVSYSTSNYDDGIWLRLNFPDAYVKAVKDAGITFVTTANNHLLDRGIDGAMRTLDVLDKAGLQHTGSFRNKAERDTVKILEVKGKRIAVLAYTYGCEGVSEDFFFTEKNRYITRLLVPRKSRWFNTAKRLAHEDFMRAKALDPDLIIAMPHMGREFAHKPNAKQRYWADYYVKEGADIVFADHPHAVQPIEWVRNGKGRESLIVYCPGNFINSYTKHDGDASMLVETYLDPDNMRPFAVGVVPLYAYGRPDGNYEGIPVSTMLSDEKFAKTLSLGELKRIEDVQRIVTKFAIGVEVPPDNLQDRYFFFADGGYFRQPVPPLPSDSLNYGSVLGQAITKAKSICFIGDSVTEGTKNGGYGWFEPMMAAFTEKTCYRYARGAETIRYFTDRVAELPEAELYVVAVGCNDIRYRNPKVCAMTPDDYVQSLEKLTDLIYKRQPKAKFVFISPWESLDFDPYCALGIDEKRKMYAEYDQALKFFCQKNDNGYVNPNKAIMKMLRQNKFQGILRDHIHPNANQGIRVFSKACLNPDL